MKYDTDDDANFYLHGSIVLHKGEPVYISRVRKGMQAECWPVGKGDEEPHLVPVQELDLQPIRLGYVFQSSIRKTMYIERLPTRAWRQGITRSNCRARGDIGFRMPHYDSRFMKEIIKPTYISLNKAARKARKHGIEIPFCRTMSVDSSSLIRYKTKIVGEYTDKKIHLMKRYTYLAELIKETGCENT